MQYDQPEAGAFFIPAPSPQEALPDTDVIQVDEQTWLAYLRQEPSPLIDWIESPDVSPHTEAEWLDWLHRRRNGGSVFLADCVKGDFVVVTTFVGTLVEGQLIIYRTRAVDTSGDRSEFPDFADAPVLMERHTQYAADVRRTHAEVFAQVKAERVARRQQPTEER